MKVFSVFLTLLFALTASAADKPNIVFIIADDMGYADVSSFGAPDVKTPAIDQIAKDGIRFPNVYAMGPECTPSRVAFLTGRYHSGLAAWSVQSGLATSGATTMLFASPKAVISDCPPNTPVWLLA